MDAEVIVVDNASKDGSVAMVRSHFPEVQCIVNTQNVGFSKANNQGVQRAKGTYLCILNPDTVVAEDTFEKIYAFAKAKPKAGVIGLQLIDGSGKYLPESKRNLPTPKISLNKMMGDGSAYYANHLHTTESGKVAVLVGAFMFIKTTIYRAVGGFDERYFMYGEDIDLSYTITQAGYDNYYVGECSIIHFKGESTVKDKTYRKRFYGAMSLFYEKHLTTSKIKSTLIKTGLKGVQITSHLANSRKVKPSLENGSLPTAYYLMTKDASLQATLSKQVAVPAVTIDQLTAVGEGGEIIFDTLGRSYKEIITIMSRLSGKKVTFKIIPKNSTFALGSNSSEGRGDVLFLHK